MSRSTRTRGALSRQIYRLGWDFYFFPMLSQKNMFFLLLISCNYRCSTYSSVASAWATPSRRAPSLSVRLLPSHPAICHTGMSALSLWMDSAPPPVQKHIQQHSQLEITGRRARSPYLFAVPTSADSVVVVTDGHSAEGTEECGNLNVIDVC